MSRIIKKIVRVFGVVFSRKTKWENIICLLLMAFDLYAIYTHIQLNGFYNELGFEFVIYFGMTFGIRYMIKDIRKNFKDYINFFRDRDF